MLLEVKNKWKGGEGGSGEGKNRPKKGHFDPKTAENRAWGGLRTPLEKIVAVFAKSSWQKVLDQNKMSPTHLKSFNGRQWDILQSISGVSRASGGLRSQNFDFLTKKKVFTEMLISPEPDVPQGWLRCQNDRWTKGYVQDPSD